ncbi:hypothetical protein BHUM_01060 [Candidatus Burkholderia humilis]|nr:hypothetical protein BHUM_01060 [Candidatus Burkholderia humilis]
MQMQESWNGLAFRRRRPGPLIVGSYHELLGPLFWALSNQSNDGNETSWYELTANVDRAHRFNIDELGAEGRLFSARDCSPSLDRLIDRVPQNKRAAISLATFARWVASTTWLEISVSASPSIARLRPMSRLDGLASRSTKPTWNFRARIATNRWQSRA